MTVASPLLIAEAAHAACSKVGSVTTCTGTTTATDAPLAEIPMGETFTNQGSATVTGTGAGYAVLGNGNETALTNRGTLTTNGASLDALEVVGNRNAVTNHGTVSTDGLSASALRASGDENSLVNHGVIQTRGNNGIGILAEGRANVLTNNNAIDTHGDGGEAISADGSGNRVVNNREIRTFGNTGNGIRLHGSDNTATNAGTVRTSGTSARGIKIDGGTGNTVFNRGSISTEGVSAYGVWVASAAAQKTIVINEAGGIIFARNEKTILGLDGDERVENYGTIETGLATAAVDLGAGQDAFLIGSTSRITGYVDGGSGSDTFALGGTANASFDVSQIGIDDRYRNFENYEKVGTSTWTVNGNNADAMPWTVKEGTLMVVGRMGGSSMVVEAGATLGGGGTVGSIDARSGSTLSPGVNGIGSLAVTGNVLIANGTTYRIDLNADQASDRIVAQGTANVQGGVVQVTALPGDYKPGSRWTILTANGGVTGQFSEATTNLAFFRPVLTKDGENIYLMLPRTDVALPGGRPVIDPYLPVTNEELPRVLDLTSGEAIVSATGVIITHDDLFRGAILCRLRCSTGGLPTFDGGAVMADYAADMPVRKGAPVPVPVGVRQQNASDWAMWGKAIASWGSTDAATGTYGIERNTAGFVAGIDSGFGTPYRFGIAAGYFSTDIDVAGLASSGNVESMHLGLYGSAAFGAWNLRGGVAYAHHELDMSRSIAFTGFSGTNTSGSSTDSLQAFGELGYMMQLSDTVAVEPFVGLTYLHIGSRGILEEGSTVALEGTVHSFDTVFSTVGARLIATVPTSAGDLTFKGLVGWRHAFGDAIPSATFSYVGDGRPFLISGTPIDRDSLLVEAGVNWSVSKSVTLSVAYSGAMGARDQEHTVRGGLTVRF